MRVLGVGRFLIAAILCAGGALQAQVVHPYLADSTLSYREYLEQVRQFHPLARNAFNLIDLAEADLRRARGDFDPALYGNYRLKEYSDTEYYKALQAGIELPTWMGLTFSAGYEDNSGAFLNPEQTVPARGLIHAGVTLQAGAGLLMDKRRADLRQAEISLRQSAVEQQLALNDLYFEASQAYFNWLYTDRALAVIQEALSLATVRYEAVRSSYTFGDVPAIDTVEAYTQVLGWLNSLRAMQSMWIEAANGTAVFLWSEDLQSVQIPPGIAPAWSDTSSALLLQSPSITAEHPQLQKLQNKQAFLDIERRLAAEYLRPKVELKYNLLTENISPAPVNDYFNDQVFFENNFQFGAKVSYPLFLREARGKVGMAKIKLEMTGNELDLKREALQLKLEALLVKLQNEADRVALARENVALLTLLVRGERQLFDNGESSLFVINARETKAVEAQIKLYELIAKLAILQAETRVAVGLGFYP